MSHPEDYYYKSSSAYRKTRDDRARQELPPLREYLPGWYPPFLHLSFLTHFQSTLNLLVVMDRTATVLLPVDYPLFKMVHEDIRPHISLKIMAVPRLLALLTSPLYLRESLLSTF